MASLAFSGVGLAIQSSSYREKSFSGMICLPLRCQSRVPPEPVRVAVQPYLHLWGGVCLLKGYSPSDPMHWPRDAGRIVLGARCGSIPLSQPGSHQFKGPKNVIRAGTRMRRIPVASRATANARPRPNSLVATSRVNPNEAKIEIIINAALVMVPAVRSRPAETARALSPVA